MKKLLPTLSLIVTMATSLFATDAWFSWTPNPSYELVSGYRIEYTKVPGVTNWTYLTFISSATNTAVVKNLSPGYVYQFRIFAVNGKGIGTNMSNVLTIPTNSPSAVNNFILMPSN